MQAVMEGKSPLCAIEKRVANGKMMAFNIGKAFGLIPRNADMFNYMRDDHSFWTEQYLAQLGSESHSNGKMEDLDFTENFDWSKLQC